MFECGNRIDTLEGWQHHRKLERQHDRALSEPLRLKILNGLRDKARNVGQLTELLESSHANVSKRLATLTRLGFIERTVQRTSAC